MENASARNLWGDFLDAHLEFASKDAPKVVRFYDNEQDANMCVDLICKETKRVVSHSLMGFQHRNEPLPKIGEFSVVMDWNGNAKCVIRTSSVKLVPFFAVREELARLEGEGDKSLEHWKKSHWSYFSRELAQFGKVPRESMIVVFQGIEMLFKR